jgi:anti-sigma B factor antagonist
MRTESHGEMLLVTGMTRLTAEDTALFKDLVRATLAAHHRILEIDLTQVRTMDSEGIGALIAVHKRLRERDGTVRMTHPTPFVSQLLRLLRLDRVLEIVE